MCWYKNAGVAGYAEAFRPVQSDSQTSEWYSYFENDVLVLEAWDKTHNAREIAKYFSVNESTVYRLVEERARTGSYETRTQMRGRKTILTEKQHHDILELVQEQPDITMKEIVETLHLPVGDEAVRRFLIKQGYTYKKKSLHACKRTGASPMCRENAVNG